MRSDFPLLCEGIWVSGAQSPVINSLVDEALLKELRRRSTKDPRRPVKIENLIIALSLARDSSLVLKVALRSSRYKRPIRTF